MWSINSTWMRDASRVFLANKFWTTLQIQMISYTYKYY